MKKMLLVALMAIVLGVQGYAQGYHYRPVPVPRYSVYYRPVMPVSYIYSPRGYWYYAALNCYWWGSSWDTPTKVKIDCITLKKKSNGTLIVKNGSEKKISVDTYRQNHFAYKCPSGVKVDILTENGSAKVNVYSADGKTTAEYTL